MIKRDRNRVAPPSDLVDANSIGQRESQEIIDWIKRRRKSTKPKFKAYKKKSVKDALEELFENKCAYCESKYASVHPVDTEHWRPKADVIFEDGTSRGYGYEWLAASWDNLLPSCIHCNRPQKHSVVRVEKRKIIIEKITVGKGNRFPVFNEKKRLKSFRDPINQEKPILINPTSDDPSKYFIYQDEVVMPRFANPKRKTKRKYDRAIKSIEIYALNRKGLVDERKSHLLIIKRVFIDIKNLIEQEYKLKKSNNKKYLNEQRKWIQETIDEKLAYLQSLARPNEKYSLMTIKTVKHFLESINRR